ncbi:MAG: hypothetical protein LBG93_07200 [Treponema sp.]|jgi:hypothetical protein|nr:hypothetical protein [Treponema sp.]
MSGNRLKPSSVSTGIGTRKESSLHKSLKLHCAGSEGSYETLVEGFVCDGRAKTGELIEVQCGSFAPLAKKVKALTEKHKMRIIHPIIAKKYIELYDTEGNFVRGKTSPKKGSEWDLFKALLHAPHLPLIKNLTIELAIVEVLEVRVNDGSGSWRRGGVSITDRRLTSWKSSVLLRGAKDYRRFVPFEKGELFTVKDLSIKAGIHKSLAGKSIYTLFKMGHLTKSGKKANALVYTHV